MKLIVAAFYMDVYFYDSAGNLLWKIALGDTPIYTGDWFFSPAAGQSDASGHIHLIGVYRKYNISGSDIPTYRLYNRHGVLKRAFTIAVSGVDAVNLTLSRVIAVDASQNVYVLLSKTNSSYQTILQKYSNTGALLWQQILVSSGFQVGAGGLILDHAGDVIVSYSSSFSSYISKRDPSDGSETWTITADYLAISLLVDASDYLFSCQYNAIMRRYDSSGALTHTGDFANINGYNNAGLLFLYDGDIYVSGYHGCNQFSAADLSTVSSYALMSPAGISDDGTFYFLDSTHTGSTTDPLVWAKTGAPNGSLLWEAAEPLNDVMFGFAQFLNIIESAETDSILLPLALSAPTWAGDRYAVSPGLAFSLALQTPRWILEPRNYADVRTQYRAYLSGTPGIVLSIASFSCQRTTQVTRFSVACRGLTYAQMVEIEARIGNAFFLQTAFVPRSGGVQYVDVFQAPLSSVRSDEGANQSSITLSAEEPAVIANPQTRTLRGISYRNEQDGRRRVRCAVDAYLQPGDTVNAGVDSWIVGDISYFVSASQATMEIAEAL